MELSYTYLRSKDVVNVADGKRLGKICDVVFSYPENCVLGIVAPGSKNIFKRNEVFIEMSAITKIGDDVILVCVNPTGKKSKPVGSVKPNVAQSRRDYGEYE